MRSRLLGIRTLQIIYEFRDPKDAAISFYHHFQLWLNFIGSRDFFLQAFIEDKVLYTFWRHVLSYWKLRNEPNVLFNTFEEMKEDLPSVLRKTAEFLNIKYTEDEEKATIEQLSFASMKNNKSVNKDEITQIMEQKYGKKGWSFMRKGEAGAWRKVLNPEFIVKFEKWTTCNLKNTDFPS